MKTGTFQPGQSGNPSGRPKIPESVREMARAASEEAIQTLVAVMRDEEAPHAARIQASDKILDRAWGKPAQPIDGDGQGGQIPVGIELRFIRPGEV